MRHRPRTSRISGRISGSGFAKGQNQRAESAIDWTISGSTPAPASEEHMAPASVTKVRASVSTAYTPSMRQVVTPAVTTPFESTINTWLCSASGTSKSRQAIAAAPRAEHTRRISPMLQHLQAVEDRGRRMIACRAGSSWEDGKNLQSARAASSDIEAFRAFDVLQIDAAQRRAPTSRSRRPACPGSVSETVDIESRYRPNFLEQTALPFHHVWTPAGHIANNTAVPFVMSDQIAGATYLLTASGSAWIASQAAAPRGVAKPNQSIGQGLRGVTEILRPGVLVKGSASASTLIHWYRSLF